MEGSQSRALNLELAYYRRAVDIIGLESENCWTTQKLRICATPINWNSAPKLFVLFDQVIPWSTGAQPFYTLPFDLAGG